MSDQFRILFFYLQTICIVTVIAKLSFFWMQNRTGTEGKICSCKYLRNSRIVTKMFYFDFLKLRAAMDRQLKVTPVIQPIVAGQHIISMRTYYPFKMVSANLENQLGSYWFRSCKHKITMSNLTMTVLLIDKQVLVPFDFGLYNTGDTVEPISATDVWLEAGMYSSH